LELRGFPDCPPEVVESCFKLCNPNGSPKINVVLRTPSSTIDLQRVTKAELLSLTVQSEAIRNLRVGAMLAWYLLSPLLPHEDLKPSEQQPLDATTNTYFFF